MPTSTTTLTEQESATIDQDRDFIDDEKLADQIPRLQAPGGPATRTVLLAKAQERKTGTSAAVRALFVSILAARSPAVLVPQGATITRQTVGGADSLVVTS